MPKGIEPAPGYNPDLSAEPQQHQEPETRALFLTGNQELAAGDSGIILDSVYVLQSHMRGLLLHQRMRRERNQLAAEYADFYRSEPEIDGIGETYDQESELVLSRLYLSAISSQGHLGQFIETRCWSPRGSSSVIDAKTEYLAARKRFQDDIDNYFDHFTDKPIEAVDEALQDTVNLSRLLVTGNTWVDSLTVTYNHMFLGSILSERVVMVSLRENVSSGTRYGTVEEDKFPTMADVIIPLPQGNMPVQVKMKWLEPTELKVKPKEKKPLHVIVPMHIIRSGLTSEEHEKLAISVVEEADKLAA